jgi:uncharacterized OB-fold protein
MTIGPVARNDATAEFFDATAEGRFLIKRCPDAHASRPQSKICDVCASPDLSYEQASGRARLVTWAVVAPRSSEGPSQVPAIAQLEEGPWWWSAVIGVDPAELKVGQPVRIGYARAEGGEAVPVFVVDPA